MSVRQCPCNQRSVVSSLRGERFCKCICGLHYLCNRQHVARRVFPKTIQVVHVWCADRARNIYRDAMCVVLQKLLCLTKCSKSFFGQCAAKSKFCRSLEHRFRGVNAIKAVKDGLSQSSEVILGGAILKRKFLRESPLSEQRRFSLGESFEKSLNIRTLLLRFHGRNLLPDGRCRYQRGDKRKYPPGQCGDNKQPFARAVDGIYVFGAAPRCDRSVRPDYAEQKAAKAGQSNRYPAVLPIEWHLLPPTQVFKNHNAREVAA